MEAFSVPDIGNGSCLVPVSAVFLALVPLGCLIDSGLLIPHGGLWPLVGGSPHHFLCIAYPEPAPLTGEYGGCLQPSLLGRTTARSQQLPSLPTEVKSSPRTQLFGEAGGVCVCVCVCTLWWWGEFMEAEFYKACAVFCFLSGYFGLQ